MNKLKAIIFFESRWVDWIFRIILSCNIIIAGMVEPEHFYPLDTLIYTLAGFWLYTFRLKTLSLIPLFGALYVNLLRFDIVP